MDWCIGSVWQTHSAFVSMRALGRASTSTRLKSSARLLPDPPQSGVSSVAELANSSQALNCLGSKGSVVVSPLLFKSASRVLLWWQMWAGIVQPSCCTAFAPALFTITDRCVHASGSGTSVDSSVCGDMQACSGLRFCTVILSHRATSPESVTEGYTEVAACCACYVHKAISLCGSLKSCSTPAPLDVQPTPIP